MDPTRIIGDIIFSAKYARTKKDFFTEVFLEWNDPEYIHDYVNKNKRFIENNIFFHGYTLKDIETAITDEVTVFRESFNKFIENSRNHEYPGLEDRFYVLSKDKKPPDARRKMYGHEENSNMMVSVLRLYAIKLPSKVADEIPCFLIIGGAIKFADNMEQMKQTRLILSRFDSVQNWLTLNKITTKEDIVQYITNHEHHND